MELPAEPWQARVRQKWLSLEAPLREALRGPLPLRESLLLARSLLRSEDEECLRRLAQRFRVDKDPALAAACKEEGNRRFRGKEFRAAAALYSRDLEDLPSPVLGGVTLTLLEWVCNVGVLLDSRLLLDDQALSHAEAGSPEMAVGYANRSAALFHLGHFEICLEDIERAQNVRSCPERLYPKILLRKAKCLLALGRLQEVAEALGSAESSMSASQRQEAAQHQMLLSRLEQLQVGACKQSSPLASPPAGLSQTGQGLEAWQESRCLSGALASVSLRFSGDRGRHLVAAEDLPPGRLLVREEAFASVLCPGEGLLLQGSVQALWDGRLTNADLHCHHCLAPLLASIPCLGCSYSRYCSPACAQLAWRSYHCQECSLGGLLLALGVFCHLALRTVLVAGFAEVSTAVAQSWGRGGAGSAAGAQATQEGPAPAGIPGCSADGRYGGSYQAVFSLLPHAERHSSSFRFLCSLSVAALCKRLAEGSLEVLAEAEAEAEAEAGLALLGEAMLRHMLQLPCNAQAVTVLRPAGAEDGPVAGREQVRLATALFPVLSLLNHSCDPNSSVAFRSNSVEVRALRPVPKGQELVHCYAGPHRARMRAAERRRLLRAQYYFECQCQACLEELQPSSTREASVPNTSLFRCLACQRPMQGEGLLRCSSSTCSKVVPEDAFHSHLHSLQLSVQAALELLEQGSSGQSLEMLQKCRLDAKRFLSPAHLKMGEIEDHLAQAYAALGRWQEAAGHLRRSLQAVEGHFGPSSIEVGQELFKLAQVLFNGAAAPEALSVVREAEAVLSVHLGTQDVHLEELREMRACLEEVLGGPCKAPGEPVDRGQTSGLALPGGRSKEPQGAGAGE